MRRGAGTLARTASIPGSVTDVRSPLRTTVGAIAFLAVMPGVIGCTADDNGGRDDDAGAGAGAGAATGAEVRAQVGVPEVTFGAPNGAVGNRLRGLGFEVKVDGLIYGSGRAPVVSMSPALGTTVDRGSVVTLRVGTGHDVNCPTKVHRGVCLTAAETP